MTRLSRLLVGAAALLLVLLYVLPLWHVRLVAPQYPEGLGMHIHLGSVQGATETDLNNINNLNHYIGMKRIESDAIPELTIMPWLVGALVAGAVLVAAAGRRRLLYVWTSVFALLGVAGLVDFWRWEYDYGHNLDLEEAIIRIPGMSYQPPLIGSKQLLNFTASSWPATGGVAAGLAFALGVVAVVLTVRARRAERALRATTPTATIPLTRVAFGVLFVLAVAPSSRAQDVVVSPSGPVRSLSDAVRLAPAGGRIVVRSGTYREPTIIVDKPVVIEGDGSPVLDGQDEREIMTVTADSVTVRGLVFRNVGSSYRVDRAAIRVKEANGCTIDDNRFERAFFGVYLARVSGCRITRNTIIGNATTEAASGNGIHLWTADHVTIADNTIRGHRDGIYFEFVHFSDVQRNVSERNLRYGLHFMFSDQCRYRDNVFRRNGSGVAVMYTRQVEMAGNRMEQNWGAAAYGLLLKEIADVTLERNVFSRNTTGLLADGTTRLTVTNNRFADNGWAIRLDANTQAGRVAANDLVGNTFDVATNGNNADTVLEGNYWDAYRGYDLKHDGYGDVPFRPVRLFSVLVERNSPALILLRSTFVALLDAAERVIPALTPDALADHRPAMRPLHLANGVSR